MSDYESKKKRMQADLDRGNEMRQSLRTPGGPRDEKLVDMVKKRITLAPVKFMMNDEPLIPTGRNDE